MEQNQFRSKSTEELSDFFHNLFFLDVSLKRGGVFKIHDLPGFVVSVYKNKNEAIIGALLMDIPAAACFAGALCDLPQDVIQQIIDNNSFPEDIWEDLQEVLNICSQLFTSYDGDSITLEEVYQHPTTLPKEAFDVLADEFNPLLFRVGLEGYGGGVIGVLDAENNSIFADMSSNAPQPEAVVAPEKPTAPQQRVTLDDDEDEAPKIVVPKIASDAVVPTTSNPLPQMVFSLLVGIVIGGLGVKALWSPEPQVVAVPSNTPVVETTTPAAMTVPKPVKKALQHPYEIEQVLISDGAFHMGCTTEYAQECIADEFPSRSVQITRSFYIMKTEVTQQQYAIIAGENPARFTKCKDDCPVENISWIQAAQFANKLSAHQGLEECYVIEKDGVTWPTGLDCLGYRLPTEAEWEYAARGETGFSQGRFAKQTKLNIENRTDKNIHVYSGANTVSSVAWYGGYESFKTDNLGRLVGVGKGHPQKVCSKGTNANGLCDMSGNVWEWVWDGYAPYQKSTRVVVDPVQSNGKLKVLRGGSWLSSANEVRTSFRMFSNPSVVDAMVPNYGSFGFRLVRTSPKIKSIK